MIQALRQIAMIIVIVPLSSVFLLFNKVFGLNVVRYKQDSFLVGICNFITGEV